MNLLRFFLASTSFIFISVGALAGPVMDEIRNDFVFKSKNGTEVYCDNFGSSILNKAIKNAKERDFIITSEKLTLELDNGSKVEVYNNGACTIYTPN